MEIEVQQARGEHDVSLGMIDTLQEQMRAERVQTEETGLVFY